MCQIGYILLMKITEIMIRRLQRSLNALGRGAGLPRVKVDGQLGRRTVAALARFLATREREGEAALVRALRALD
jgi:lysozyme family protein